MIRARSVWVSLCGLLVIWAAGCTSPDQIQMETLQRKIQDLDNENASLRERLARAISERDAAIQRANALAQQVRDLQSQLDQAGRTKGPAGWEHYGQYDWIGVGTDFLFDSGKATLRAEGRAKLQEIVSTINTEFPDKMVWVLGHTDTDPIKQTKNLWQDNLDLSCNRAMTVYRELMKMGLRPERMVAGGQGEYFPRASNANRAGKAQNRRVEIIAVPSRPAVGTPSGEAEPASAAPPRAPAGAAAKPAPAKPAPTKPAAPAVTTPTNPPPAEEPPLTPE